MQFFETLAAQVNDGSFMTTYVERVSSASGVADVADASAVAPAVARPAPAPAKPAEAKLVDL